MSKDKYTKYTKEYCNYHEIMDYFEKEYNIDRHAKRKFWHWFIDEFDTQFFNGCIINFNPLDFFMKDGENFDLHREYDVLQILRLWYVEFGDQDIKLLIEW